MKTLDIIEIAKWDRAVALAAAQAAKAAPGLVRALELGMEDLYRHAEVTPHNQRIATFNRKYVAVKEQFGIDGLVHFATWLDLDAWIVERVRKGTWDPKPAPKMRQDEVARKAHAPQTMTFRRAAPKRQPIRHRITIMGRNGDVELRQVKNPKNNEVVNYIVARVKDGVTVSTTSLGNIPLGEALERAGIQINHPVPKNAGEKTNVGNPRHKGLSGGKPELKANSKKAAKRERKLAQRK